MNTNNAEQQLNFLLQEINKLSIPKGGVAIFHIKECNKAELMDLSAKLNIKLIKPEDNLFADHYTLKVDPNPNVQILLHSQKVVFQKKEIPAGEMLRRTA